MGHVLRTWILSPNAHFGLEACFARKQGRARFASRGGVPNKNIGFPRSPPTTCAVFLGGGVGLTPQEAEEGQTPQKLRLERGKEANDSQFPLESHFFTTNFMNKKIKKL